MDRRTFIGGAAALTAGVALGACSGDDDESTDRTTTTGADAPAGSTTTTPSTAKRGVDLDRPGGAPFDTVVVLMMENRSFDHLLGWLPGAEGIPEGHTYPTQEGERAEPWPMAGDLQGCDYYDPAHDWESMHDHLADGACDGFLLTQPSGDLFPISYYDQEDLPVMAELALGHTVLDHYFCSVNGPTWPNRLYQLAAATDLDITSVLPDTGPGPSAIDLTIFDRVQEAGLTAGYYGFPDAMMTSAFASRRYDDITFPFEQFLTDAKAGELPNVVFVDPDWSVLKIVNGTSSDFHPPSSTRLAERLVADVYEALADSPHWEKLVFVINFDESGGFADHVLPPKVQDDNVNPNPGPHPDYTQLGPRVPCIVGGPFAPAGVVSEGPYEHCSVLRMIEWRWELEPMTARDRHAKNLAEVLAVGAATKPLTMPTFDVPDPTECAIQVATQL